jgi:hypothetical protein
MLILKGNFQELKWFWLLLAAVLACFYGPLQVATAAAARAPDAVAAEFYGWYLDTLSADQDPLSDRYERFSSYVARPLVEQLAGRLRSGPALPAAAPASDYFLKVTSYRAAWLHARPRAMIINQGARQAEVVVTLGEGSDARQVLGLGMVLENGAWKIRQVVRAEPERPESSARPPVI